MKPLTLAEIADAVGGRLGAAAEADRLIGPDVVIDSRQVNPGALFVAVPGERVDGFDFIRSAIDAGAAAALASRDVDGVPVVVVPDPVTGLGRLGTHVLRASDARVVAVTGSQGKTSTKDLLAQLLEAHGPTVAPVGSYNNEYGLPLTAIRVTPDTRWLISEMGARGEGHIQQLCELTPPDTGIVLNVGQAHLGGFGDRDAIARTKGELPAALPSAGWAVLNAQDPRVAAMATRTVARLAWWAQTARPEPDGELRVWASDHESDEFDRHRFVIHAEGLSSPRVRSAQVQLTTPGRHQVGNALAAATAALTELGLSEFDAVAAGLSAAQARSTWRMELNRVAIPGGDVMLINDAYNANPDSMLAALESLAQIARHRRVGYHHARAVAVLGDMLELGSATESEHRAVGRAAAALGVDVLIGVGDNAESMTQAALEAGPAISVRNNPLGSLGETQALAAEVAASVRPGDTVLVKASRGQRLEEFAAALSGHFDTLTEGAG